MKPRPSFPARLPDAVAGPRRPSSASRGPGARATVPASDGEQPGARRAIAAPAVQRMRPASPVAEGGGQAAARRALVMRLRRAGLADDGVAAAIESVERECFVDSALRGQAYEDTSLPIGLGQTISKPSVVARMLELLRAGRAAPLGRVLEIGTGCGYQAAVLSRLATEVYSIERLRGLHDKARDNLRRLRLPNVHLLFGDGMVGYAKGAPYAGIVSAAGGDAVPQAWIDQLAVGGRIVAPTVQAGASQALVVIERTPSGVRSSVCDAVHFVPLKSGVA